MVLEDRSSLWYRVLCQRYGHEGGQLCIGKGDGSVWWHTMNTIWEGVGQFDGGWLRDNISWKVGDETFTLFWIYP